MKQGETQRKIALAETLQFDLTTFLWFLLCLLIFPLSYYRLKHWEGRPPSNRRKNKIQTLSSSHDMNNTSSWFSISNELFIIYLFVLCCVTQDKYLYSICIIENIYEYNYEQRFMLDLKSKCMIVHRHLMIWVFKTLKMLIASINTSG